MYAVFEAGTVDVVFGSTEGGIYTIGEEEPNEENTHSGVFTYTAVTDTDVTTVAAPNKGYLFNGWYEGIIGEDEALQPNSEKLLTSDSQYTFKAVPGVRLYAVFEEGYVNGFFGTAAGGTYFIFKEDEEEGSSYSEPYNCELIPGSIVKVKAIADKGYLFAGWYEGVVGESGFVEDRTETQFSYEPQYEFIVTPDVRLYCYFEECPHDQEPAAMPDPTPSE